MKIPAPIFHLGFCLFLVLCGTLNLSGPLPLQILTGFWICLIAPGFSIVSLFLKKRNSAAEFLLLSAGISISIIMITGLLLSISRPLSGLSMPLHKYPVLTTLLTIPFVCHLLSAVLHRTEVYQVKLRSNDIFGCFLLLALSALSVLGVLQLNILGSNMLSIFTLIAFPVSGVVLLIALRKGWVGDIFPVYFYTFGISLQWVLSLRSWHISGFDISTEYKVFLLTKSFGYWDINLFRNAYNACLSITILPTVLSNIIPITPEYMFKMIYPLLFSLVPVMIYVTWSKLLHPVAGYLSALFFMCFPWFVDPLTTILRQEIAFLFFSLMIFVLLDKDLPKKFRFGAFYLFTSSLVLSHYSTTYVSIVIFGLTYLTSVGIFILKNLKYISRYLKKWPLPVLGNKGHDISLINIVFLVYFCSFTYLWNGAITKTSKNIQDLAEHTFESIISPEKSVYSGMIDDVKGLFIKRQKVDPYAAFQAQKIKQFSDRFPLEAVPIQRATVEQRSPLSLPIRNIPIYRAAQKVFTFFTLFAAGLPFIAGLITIFGFKINALEDQAWLSNLWIGIYGVVAAIILVPYISIGYNFERIFMHGMLLTAVSPALIVVLIHRFTKRLWIPTFLVVSCIFGFYAFNFGLVWQVVGGKPVMWLNNKGISYDLTYTHSGEVAAATFLKNKGSTENIHTSSKGRNILTAYANPKSISVDTLALLVIPGSYIFSHNVNVTQQMDYFSWAGTQTGFRYQTEDFNRRFNKVYANNSAVLYK